MDQQAPAPGAQQMGGGLPPQQQQQQQAGSAPQGGPAGADTPPKPAQKPVRFTDWASI